MPTYDSTQFAPPAPLARVTLRASNNYTTVTDVPMLVDTGADLTLIPERFVSALKLEPEQSESYELEGFDGRKSLARSIRLEMVFLKRTFRGRFVVINSESGILGGMC
jgi:hypothetical protein